MAIPIVDLLNLTSLSSPIKRSQIGEDNEVKFNKSTIGIATKKALESGTARIVKRMIKRGIFKE